MVTRKGYTVELTGSVTSLTIEPDETCAVGDWMLMSFMWASNEPTSTPVGWEKLAESGGYGTRSSRIFARIRQSGDTSYEVPTGSGGVNCDQVVLMWGDGHKPIADWTVGDGAARATNATSTTCKAPGISMDPGVALAISHEATGAAESGVTISGATEWIFAAGSSSPLIHTASISYNTLEVTGSTGDVTVTYPNTQAANGWAIQIGIPSAEEVVDPPVDSVQAVWDATFDAPPVEDTPTITALDSTTVPSVTGTLIREKRLTTSTSDLDIDDDPNFRYGGAGSYIPHPANPSSVVYPALVTGGASQSARYSEDISFITDETNSTVYIHMRRLVTSVSLRISVNGKWLTLASQVYSTPSTFWDLKLEFPSAASRLIKIEGTGQHWCFGGVVVEPGEGLTRPPAPPETVVWIGDSYAGGAGSAATDGANSIETACNFITEMMGWSTFYHLGVGGTGWITTAPFGDRVTEALTYAPDVVVIDGSNNDPNNATAVQAAVEAGLDALASVSTVIVAGVHRGTGENNDAIKTATLSRGRTFIDYIAGGWFEVGPDTIADNVHPTFEGHQKIAKGFYAALMDSGETLRAPLSGSGTLEAEASVALAASAPSSGTGSLTASPSPHATSGVDSRAAGALSTLLVPEVAASAQVIGVGVLLGALSGRVSITGPLTGKGSSTFVYASLSVSTAVGLAGGGSLSATTGVTQDAIVAGDLLGAGTLSGTTGDPAPPGRDISIRARLAPQRWRAWLSGQE